MTSGALQDVPSRGRRGDGAGTTGAAPGTTGAAAILVILAAATVVNALTARADHPHAAAWEPWVLEASSALVLALLAWLPWLALALAPFQLLNDGWPARVRLVAVHLGAVLAFSAVHVAGMLALRRGVYSAMGEIYAYGRGDGVFVYEFRKDVLTYAVFAAVFWLARRLRQGREAPVRPASFDIRDGARLIRAPVGEILAATSAGNYVEFVLADGRRPLMRATLAAVEAEIGEFGFVRTHRSWLVNAGRMTGLRPEGSGDWTVELGSQAAPLSRRYPAALEQLRRRKT